MSVGALERGAGGVVRPDSVDPADVHLPVVFNLAHFYRQERDNLNSQLEALNAERAALRREWAALPPAGGWAVRRNRERLAARLQERDRTESTMTHWRHHCEGESASTASRGTGGPSWSCASCCARTCAR